MSDDKLIHDESAGIERLLEIMRRLRDPESGCPWDVEQSFATIAPYTIEEAYEVADAIERKKWDELKRELGDLLFQSVFHAQMADEAGYFNFQDVVTTMSNKMVSRHPHVFGDESREKSADQQTADWEEIKAAERADKAQQGTLDGVAVGLPALLRAYKLQKRAARVGFDWPSADNVIDKIAEPLTHMIRNAVDHGLETPEKRTEIGKNAEGILKLSAKHRSGRIVIEIADDGAGINRERDMMMALKAGTGVAPVTIWHTETELPDVFILEPPVFGDDRGFFQETFNQRKFLHHA